MKRIPILLIALFLSAVACFAIWFGSSWDMTAGDDGPVVIYAMQTYTNAAGKFPDSSGKGNDGDIYGDVSYNVDVRPYDTVTNRSWIGNVIPNRHGAGGFVTFVGSPYGEYTAGNVQLPAPTLHGSITTTVSDVKSICFWACTNVLNATVPYVNGWDFYADLNGVQYINGRPGSFPLTHFVNTNGTRLIWGTTNLSWRASDIYCYDKVLTTNEMLDLRFETLPNRGLPEWDQNNRELWELADLIFSPKYWMVNDLSPKAIHGYFSTPGFAPTRPENLTSKLQRWPVVVGDGVKSWFGINYQNDVAVRWNDLNPHIHNTTNMTCAAWVRNRGAYDGTDLGTVFNKFYSGGSGQRFVYNRAGIVYATIAYNNWNQYRQVQSTVPLLPSNEWHHIAFTYSKYICNADNNTNGFKLYCDGVWITNVIYGEAGAAPGIVAYQSDLELGRTFIYPTTFQQAQSDIGNFRLWSGLESACFLSGEQIADMYATESNDWQGAQIASIPGQYILTIPQENIDAPITNMPVLIRIARESGTNGFDTSDIFEEIGTNYFKLRILDSEFNDLFVEIDEWNWTGNFDTSEGLLWVKVPLLSATNDTVLYLQYDDSQPLNTNYVGAVGSAAGQTVWTDNGFVLVTHMKEGPSQNTKDSTTNNYTCVFGGGNGRYYEEQSAVVGKGIYNNEFSEWVLGSATLTHGDSARTLTLYCKSVAGGFRPDGGILFYTGLSYWGGLTRASTFGPVKNYTKTSGGAHAAAKSGLDEYGVFHYYGSTWGASGDGKTRLYYDGVLTNTTDHSSIGGTIQQDYKFWLSADPYQDPSRSVRQVSDEVRIADVERSPAWMKADYLSVSDDLITYSAFTTNNVWFDPYRDELAGHWYGSEQDASNYWRDISGHGWNLEPKPNSGSGPTLIVTGTNVWGRRMYAWKFDGVDDYWTMDMTNSTYTGMSDYLSQRRFIQHGSIAYWVYAIQADTNTADNGMHFIMHNKQEPGLWSYFFSRFEWGTGRNNYRWWVQRGTDNRRLSVTTGPETVHPWIGKWTHIVAVQTGDDSSTPYYYLKVYVNGVDSGATAGWFGTSANRDWLTYITYVSLGKYRVSKLDVGSFNGGSQFHEGYLADIRLYHRELTRDEAWQLFYNTPPTRNIPGANPDGNIEKRLDR